jgi:hypothetical protein
MSVIRRLVPLVSHIEIAVVEVDCVSREGTIADLGMVAAYSNSVDAVHSVAGIAMESRIDMRLRSAADAPIRNVPGGAVISNVDRGGTRTGFHNLMFSQ